MKKKTLTVLVVLTMLSSILFAQSVLGASYYWVDWQKTSGNRNSDTYNNYYTTNSGKVTLISSGPQKIYSVYPSANQDGYYHVFVNRSFGYNLPEPQEPPVQQEQPKPEPQEPPAQPEQPKPEPQEPPVQQEQPKPEPEQPGANKLTADEQKLINLINSERTKAGLNALAVDYELSGVARIKSEDMRTNNYFSHTSPTYGSPFQMMKDFGITYRSAAENIAKTSSVDRAHTGFMNSEGHRKNILTPGFTHIGVGISGNYYTEMFISK
ncbi:MAG: CAP domain-containing protein [Firmicutes bacterium]|nr:CAP domain-containing protein [Bacillota bacterium]MDD3851163.1 CAP domain-containing protein [Bacillota bacterium]MDD4707496.1 CAP domain-containing protein [Bacillota bacterium]